MRDHGFEEPAEYLTIRNGPGLTDEIERVSRELEAQWSGT